MKSPWWILAVGILAGIGIGFMAFRKPAVAPTVNGNLGVNQNANANQNTNENAIVNAVGNANTTTVASFDACVTAGYPVVESYPRRCTVPGGSTFTEDIGNANEMKDLIRVTEPAPNGTVESPMTVTGEARGSWYFEGVFRVQLLDGYGTEIVAANATAKGEWMTTNFVPFEVHLTFPKPTTAKGMLILHKDNPSGLPANDAELRVPVRFTTNG
jgi:hypothetical protein